MKVALLDARKGSLRGPSKPNTWKLNPKSAPSDHLRNENTFAFLEIFDEVLLGPLEQDTDYSVLSDYDLVYLRIREPRRRDYIKAMGIEDLSEIKPVKQLREACPDAILIGYCDEWVNRKTSNPLQNDMMNGLKELSLNLDAITCGFGKQYQETLFSKYGFNNYYHLPYAGDVECWKKWAKLPSEKEYRISGMWHRRSYFGHGRGNQIHTITFDVMKKLQKKYNVDCQFYLNFDGWHIEDEIKNYLNKIGLKCKLLKHIENMKFNQSMSEDLIFIEEYPTPAFSRATVVSACVKTPSISSYLNDPSRVCFPDLTVKADSNYSLRIEELAEKLITDETFYREQADAGYENVEYYFYPAYKERILTLYNKLREERNK